MAEYTHYTTDQQIAEVRQRITQLENQDYVARLQDTVNGNTKGYTNTADQRANLQYGIRKLSDELERLQAIKASESQEPASEEGSQ